MDADIRPSTMNPDDLETMLNPLSAEDLASLEDVDAIVQVTQRLLSRAEMAGLDVKAIRAELEKNQQQARALLAAFGQKQG